MTESQPSLGRRGEAVAASLYRYTDADGNAHLVQSVDEVPPSLRTSARAVNGAVSVDAPSAGEKLLDEADFRALQVSNATSGFLHKVEDEGLLSVGWAAHLHLPSLGLGAAAGFALMLLWGLVRRRPARALRAIALVALLAGMTAGYVSWVRLAKQLTPGTSSANIVEQARRAATREQERLQRLGESSKQ